MRIGMITCQGQMKKKEVHHVIENAYNYLEKKLFYINGLPNEPLTSYYNSTSIKMTDIYKDKWYIYISNLIYETINI